MTEQTQEQVAKTLKDSGLFEIYTALYRVTWQCGEVEYSKFVIEIADSCELIGRTLTADQSEAILAEMPHQLVWDELNDCFMLGNFEEYEFLDDGISDFGFRWVEDSNFRDFGKLKKHQRYLAILVYIAWCCDNMRAELELAIKEVSGGK